MKRIIPIIVALVTAGGISLVATRQDGTTTQADGPNVLQIIAASAALAGQMPPPGQCVAAEVALAVNDDPDASGAAQRTYELCSLSTDAGADALDKLAKQCKQAAGALCDLYDAGEDDKAISKCERAASNAAAIGELQSSGKERADKIEKLEKAVEQIHLAPVPHCVRTHAELRESLHNLRNEQSAQKLDLALARNDIVTINGTLKRIEDAVTAGFKEMDRKMDRFNRLPTLKPGGGE